MFPAALAKFAPPPADADLLGRFAAGRDGEAFAELVRRHGPMVLAVCRRLTRHAHDAEDAFQAVFLVLARKAGRLGPGDPVGGWLYGVAVRAARKAAARTWRRRVRETLVAAVPDVPARPAEPFDPEAVAVVADEVGRLPGWLRDAVVLCELEGRSRLAAARELGIAEGTLSSRLAAARKRLAARLAARGFAPAVLAALASVAVPQRLASAASALGSGAPAPPAVAALAHGVSRAMVPHKLLVVSLAVGMTAVVSLVAAAPAGRVDVPRPVAPPLRVAAQPEPSPVRPAGPGTILVLQGQGRSFLRFDPSGKKLGEVDAPKGLKAYTVPALSPDGTRLAAVTVKDEPPTPVPFKLVISPLAGRGDPKVIDMPEWTLESHWAPDGKSVFVTRLKTQATWTYEHLRVDPVSGKSEPLPLPDGCHLLDAAPDGKTFLVEHRQPDGKGRRLALATAGATEVRPLTDIESPPWFVVARVSPDGKRVLFLDLDPTRKDAHKHKLSLRPYLLDVASGERKRLAEFPENGQAWGAAWSPDGRQVAYTWELLQADRLAMDQYRFPGMEYETFLMVADADGRNARTLTSDKSLYLSSDGSSLGWIDWR